MSEPTTADALERMRRQVRAVRWRRNLHELQRALYHLIATLAGAATMLVVLALRARPAALAAVGVFLLALLLAPWLRPSAPPETVRPAGTQGRLVVARSARTTGRRVRLLALPDRDDELPVLSRVPAALQERIREQLWGE